MFSRFVVLTVIMAALLGATSARAQSADKVKVGMFPISSSLPFYVALDLGYFKDLGIEPEVSRLMGGPPNVAALITNQIEVSAVLVTLEGNHVRIPNNIIYKEIMINSSASTSTRGSFDVIVPYEV